MAGLFGRISKLVAILFGLALFHFIMQLVLLIRLRQEKVFVTAAGWNPVVVLTQPLLLLLGAICLLINRRWSYVLAILFTGGLVYSNIYLGLVGISHAHGVARFGITALCTLFEVMSGTQIMDLAFGQYERHINNRANGFKRELTEAGGQGAGVYGHVLGQAGAKLGGLTTNVIGGLADAYDFAQWLWGSPQAPAEMAGNRAGWAVGQHLYNFLTGKTPSQPERLRNSLTLELCQ